MSKFEKMEKEIREFHKLWIAEYIAKTIEVKHRIYKKDELESYKYFFNSSCKSQYKNAQKVENKNVQKSDCVYVDSDISESIFILSFKRYELPFILIICE